MSILKLLVAAILFANCLLASGQDEKKPMKSLSVREFSLQPAFFQLPKTFASESQFRSLAPTSALLNRDHTGFSPSGNFFYGSSSSVSLSLGMLLADKTRTSVRKNPVLRMGVTFVSASFLTSGLNGRSKGGSDTLISAQTGKMLIIDSLIFKRYDMEYRAQQVRLDVSLVFRTHDLGRWQLFAGVGINGGFSVSTKTTIDYNERKWVQYGGDGIENQNGFRYFPTPLTSENVTNESEKFRNKNSLAMLVYVPVGLDFRIGKNHPFWKMTHVFYELRPGVNILFVRELQTFASTSMQHGLGLRMAW